MGSSYGIAEKSTFFSLKYPNISKSEIDIQLHKTSQEVICRPWSDIDWNEHNNKTPHRPHDSCFNFNLHFQSSYQLWPVCDEVQADSTWSVWRRLGELQAFLVSFEQRLTGCFRSVPAQFFMFTLIFRGEMASNTHNVWVAHFNSWFWKHLIQFVCPKYLLLLYVALS